jgi:hypothetical protein
MRGLTRLVIGFYRWMKENDTPENAEKWFGYSDEDMLNAYVDELENNRKEFKNKSNE